MRQILYPTPESERVTDGRQARWVSTDDVLAAFSRAAGRDLADVFEVYVRQPAVPRLAVERDGEDLVLRWLTGDLVFDQPIEVGVGTDRQRVEMVGGTGRLVVAEGADWVIDPDGRVLFERAD